ncbi:MAG TPA: hypothetical protein VLA32_05800 [Anaerolineales bacterium]|jgi:hypothetical protein|nr:hypothetical protein [Anaerolineales bacterium]
MLDDFDMDFPEEEDELEEEDSSSTSNRTFMMVAGGLGALVIIALVCVAVYVFLIKPGRDANTQSTQTAQAFELAQVQTRTQAAVVQPTNTPLPTNTPVPPTNTPLPTATQAPVEDGSGGGPTPDPRTATVQALLTQAALAQTQAAQQLLTQTSTPTATGLPDTGIADDLGNISPQVMLGLAGLLILVIFIARRLRASTG